MFLQSFLSQNQVPNTEARVYFTRPTLASKYSTAGIGAIVDDQRSVAGTVHGLVGTEVGRVVDAGLGGQALHVKDRDFHYNLPLSPIRFPAYPPISTH